MSVVKRNLNNFRTNYSKFYCHLDKVLAIATGLRQNFLIKTELNKYNTVDLSVYILEKQAASIRAVIRQLRLARDSHTCTDEDQNVQAMENFTVNENFTWEMSKAFISELQIGLAEFLSAFNMFLSITASLSNALILVALHKETSFHPPTKLLFRCLATTDLSVGVISQPLFAVFLLLSATTGMKLKYYIKKLYLASSFVLCPVSVFTSTAITVDRLQALVSGLRYRHVVTLPRVRAVVMCFWLIGILCGSVSFWDANIALIVAFALTTCSLTLSLLSCVKIFRKLRHHQLQIHSVPQGQPNGRQVPLNIARYKKSVSSAIWVKVAQVICYTPFLIVVMLMTCSQMSEGKFQIAFNVTATLTYLNSTLNPALYCWRIRAVRQATKETIKQLNCCKSA